MTYIVREIAGMTHLLDVERLRESGRGTREVDIAVHQGKSYFWYALCSPWGPDQLCVVGQAGRRSDAREVECMRCLVARREVP